MFIIKKPMRIKVNGVTRVLEKDQKVNVNQFTDKTSQSLLKDGFIETYNDKDLVFHHGIEKADNFNRYVDKELQKLPDLNILDNPVEIKIGKEAVVEIGKEAVVEIGKEAVVEIEKEAVVEIEKEAVAEIDSVEKKEVKVEKDGNFWGSEKETKRKYNRRNKGKKKIG